MTICPEVFERKEDRLIIAHHCKCHGVRIVRKRLPKSTSAFDRKIQNIYAKDGPVYAIKFIKEHHTPGTVLSLSEAFGYLRKLRGAETTLWITYRRK
jgi:hypothetical protein